MGALLKELGAIALHTVVEMTSCYVAAVIVFPFLIVAVIGGGLMRLRE
jgi:hypothetical protein